MYHGYKLTRTSGEQRNVDVDAFRSLHCSKGPRDRTCTDWLRTKFGLLVFRRVTTWYPTKSIVGPEAPEMQTMLWVNQAYFRKEAWFTHKNKLHKAHRTGQPDPLQEAFAWNTLHQSKWISMIISQERLDISSAVKNMIDAFTLLLFRAAPVHSVSKTGLTIGSCLNSCGL